MSKAWLLVFECNCSVTIKSLLIVICGVSNYQTNNIHKNTTTKSTNTGVSPFLVGFAWGQHGPHCTIAVQTTQLVQKYGWSWSLNQRSNLSSCVASCRASSFVWIINETSNCWGHLVSSPLAKSHRNLLSKLLTKSLTSFIWRKVAILQMRNWEH